MNGRDERPDYTIEEAIEKFINRKRPNWKGETERTYRKGLETFKEYAEEVGIETLSDLVHWKVGDYTDWLLDYEYDDGESYSKVTVEGRQKQARRWLKWLESQDLVITGIHVAIETLKLDDNEYSSDDILAPEDIREYLVMYRNSTKWRGTRGHALLEVVAHLGARRQGIRALDLSDWDPEERTLSFINRPDTGTRLKEGSQHERKVILSEDPAAALDEYIARERCNKRDEHGRKPLFASRQGRPSESTISNWMYQATVPCLKEQCPHSRERHNCEWAHQQTKSSQCPSSSSPHPARRGSITWQLNIGKDPDEVAARAGTTPGVIDRYYDQPDLDAELRRRITDFDGIDICKHEDPTDIDGEVEDE